MLRWDSYQYNALQIPRVRRLPLAQWVARADHRNQATPTLEKAEPAEQQQGALGVEAISAF
jgi:hypothetical protein